MFLFVHSFVRSFVRSFLRSFVCLIFGVCVLVYCRLHIYIRHNNIYDKHKQLKELQIINYNRNITTSYCHIQFKSLCAFSWDAVIVRFYLLHNTKFVFKNITYVNHLCSSFTEHVCFINTIWKMAVNNIIRIVFFTSCIVTYKNKLNSTLYLVFLLILQILNALLIVSQTWYLDASMI